MDEKEKMLFFFRRFFTTNLFSIQKLCEKKKAFSCFAMAQHPMEECAILISDFLSTQDFMNFMKITKTVYFRNLKKTRKWRKLYMCLRCRYDSLSSKAQKMYEEQVKDIEKQHERDLLQVQIMLNNKKSLKQGEIIAVVPWIFRNYVKFELCNGHWTIFIDYDCFLSNKLQKYVYRRKDSNRNNIDYFEKLAQFVTDIDNFQNDNLYMENVQIQEEHICTKIGNKYQLANPNF